MSGASARACRVTLSLDPNLGRLPEATELSIFRIVQEGLNNVRKHAAAETVEIRLEHTSPRRLMLSIADDGRGLPDDFDLASYQPKATMAYWASPSGWRFWADSGGFRTGPKAARSFRWKYRIPVQSRLTRLSEPPDTRWQTLTPRQPRPHPANKGISPLTLWEIRYLSRQFRGIQLPAFVR